MHFAQTCPHVIKAPSTVFSIIYIYPNTFSHNFTDRESIEWMNFPAEISIITPLDNKLVTISLFMP